MRLTSHLPVLLAAALGCGGPGAVTPRVITGHARLRSADGGLTAVDVHRTFFETTSDDGKGGWIVRRGLATAEGTFSIADVPAGSYWLRIHDESVNRDDYLWTDADALDFDQEVPGTSKAVAAGEQAKGRFKVSGLEKWAPEDSLQLVIGRQGFSSVVYPGPDADATSLDLTTLWYGWPLLTPDDEALLVQYGHAAQGTVPGYVALRAASFAGVTQRDGTTTQLTGAFTTPKTSPFHLVWKRSAFAALQKAVHPSRALLPDMQQFELDAMPGGISRGLLVPLPPLVLAVDEDALGGNDDKDWTFQLPNPYPDDWLVARFAVSFPVREPVPGDASQPPQYAIAVVSQEIPAPLGGVLQVEPLVSPVREPLVAGKDLFADQSAVGLTPEVSWKAPATGTPTGYLLYVYRWERVESGSGALGSLAELAVPGDVTRVRLPPGLLEHGHAYVLAIRAISQAGQDVRHHAIFQTALPHAVADVVGNTFQP